MSLTTKHTEKVSSVIYIFSQITTFILAFLINVLMTNYSSDAIYGQYKYATNFILTIPALFSFGITWSCASLIARKEVNHKSGIITASIIYTVIIGVIITLVLYFYSCISFTIASQTIKNLKLVFPFIVFFLLQKLVNQVYIGMGQSLKLSLYSVAPNLITFSGLLISVLLFNRINYVYAILLYLFSYVVVIIPKLLSIDYDISNFRNDSLTLFSDVKKSGIKVHLSSIFTTSSTQIIAMVCGNVYGYSEYGYYSLATSLATVFQFIGSSLAVVNFKYYANSNRINKKDILFMVLLGGFAYVCMFVLIDTVFFWFYPKSYEPTIIYLKLLCFSNLIYGFSALFNRFFIGKGLGSVVMKNSFITAIATVLINIPMILLFEMRGMAIAAILVSFICLFSYICDYRSYQHNIKLDGIRNENKQVKV